MLVFSFKKLRIATDRMSGRSRGFAFLDFDDKSAAESAVAALNGLQVDGRDLKFDVSEPKERGAPREPRDNSRGDSRGERPPRVQPSSENSIFVGNLDFSVSDQMIQEMCENVLGAGEVKKVRIAMDRETGTFTLTV